MNINYERFKKNDFIKSEEFGLGFVVDVNYENNEMAVNMVRFEEQPTWLTRNDYEFNDLEVTTDAEDIKAITSWLADRFNYNEKLIDKSEIDRDLIKPAFVMIGDYKDDISLVDENAEFLSYDNSAFIDMAKSYDQASFIKEMAQKHTGINDIFEKVYVIDAEYPHQREEIALETFAPEIEKLNELNQTSKREAPNTIKELYENTRALKNYLDVLKLQNLKTEDRINQNYSSEILAIGEYKSSKEHHNIIAAIVKYSEDYAILEYDLSHEDLVLIKTHMSFPSLNEAVVCFKENYEQYDRVVKFNDEIKYVIDTGNGDISYSSSNSRYLVEQMLERIVSDYESEFYKDNKLYVKEAIKTAQEKRDDFRLKKLKEHHDNSTKLQRIQKNKKKQNTRSL
jgi:hypothetical protein